MTVPPGWPAGVPAPDAPDWQRKAVAWLLDLCPPDYRSYAVLTQHPLVLARFAADHVAAGITAARIGLAGVRSDLADVVPPEALEAAVDTYEREGRRLEQTARSVALLDAALRGRRFTPKL